MLDLGDFMAFLKNLTLGSDYVFRGGFGVLGEIILLMQIAKEIPKVAGALVFGLVTLKMARHADVDLDWDDDDFETQCPACLKIDPFHNPEAVPDLDGESFAGVQYDEPNFHSRIKEILLDAKTMSEGNP